MENFHGVKYTTPRFLDNEFGDWDHENENDLTVDGTDLVDLDYNKHFHRVKARFEVCDENDDGKLDLDEFMSFKNFPVALDCFAG